MAKAVPGQRGVQSGGRPSLNFEKRAWQAGKTIVAGVDEAGRGAWAGPLVAASVILPIDPYVRGQLTRSMRQAGAVVRDSKMLSAAQRMRAMHVLREMGVSFAVAVVDVNEIDAIGLGVANRLALCNAVGLLPVEPQHVLVDAFHLKDLPCSHEPVVHGDALSETIAMASIVAKVHRDALLTQLGAEYPFHGFGVHKGYGTAAHRSAIDAHGLTPHHRTSFAPIAEILTRVARG